ncbi:MAG: hypothetical protein ABJA50_12195, partial [Chloroflexota bacterium]
TSTVGSRLRLRKAVMIAAKTRWRLALELRVEDKRTPAPTPVDPSRTPALHKSMVCLLLPEVVVLFMQVDHSQRIRAAKAEYRTLSGDDLCLPHYVQSKHIAATDDSQAWKQDVCQTRCGSRQGLIVG